MAHDGRDAVVSDGRCGQGCDAGERFVQVGTCQKVLLSFRNDGLLVPRFQTSGPDAGLLLWKKASEAALYDILRNPAYAGAFVYGRHGPHPDRRPGQHARMIDRPMEDWTAVHHDVYPASTTQTEPPQL